MSNAIMRAKAGLGRIARRGAAGAVRGIGRRRRRRRRHRGISAAELRGAKKVMRLIGEFETAFPRFRRARRVPFSRRGRFARIGDGE